MIYNAVEKVAAAIAFKFICGIAGIIVGLLLIIDFSRLTQAIGIFSQMLVAVALLVDSAIVKKDEGSTTLTKILFWLGIVGLVSMFILMFLGGYLLVNIPLGILLITSSIIVAIITAFEWKSFSTV